MTEQLPSRAESRRPGASAPSRVVRPAWGPGNGPPEWETGIPWHRYAAAAWRYRWMVLGVTLLGTAAGAGIGHWLPAQYRAEAMIWIDRADPRAAERGPIGSGELLESYAWADVVTSYVVLDEVVRKLGLYLRPGSPEDSAAFRSFRLADRLAERHRPGKYELEVDASRTRYELRTRDGAILEGGLVGDSIGRGLGFLWQPTAESLPAGDEVEFAVATLRDASRDLADELRVRIDPSGSFLNVELRGRDPVRITRIVNRLSERAVEVAGQLKTAKVGELTGILEEQLRQAEASLGEAESAFEAFRARTITLPSDRRSPSGGSEDVAGDPAFTRFFDLETEREQVRRDREALARALAEARNSTLPLAALEAVPAVQRSSELSRALADLSDRRVELRGLRQRYTDRHPDVGRVLEEIRALEETTVPALAAALGDQLAAREARLGTAIGAASRDLRAIPARAIDEARLRRRLHIAEEVYTNVRQRYEGTRLAAASSLPDVRVLDAAVVPQEPVSDRLRRRLAALAFLVSLGLGLVGAVVRDRVDPRLREPAEVTLGLGLSILGAVPHLENGRRRGRTVERAAELHEAFRVIRHNVAQAYGAAGPVVFTVTSPGVGDGKSFVAVNLARVFAELGLRTLLIDGDIRRGALHERLGCDRKPGLTDVLAGRAPHGDIARATDHPALHLVPGGSRMERGPELLASPEMRRLLADLRAIYDVVVIDSPPLGAGVDPLVLGTLTGHLLLVLRAGATHREWAEAKLDLLDRLPIRILGAVLNDVPAGGAYRAYAYLPGYVARDETTQDAPPGRASGV